MRKRRILSVVLSLLLLVALLAFFTRLLMPKHATSMREGALVSEYYYEADKGREHQVLFLGDCEAYLCFIPAIIWEECGITSFVRGSPAERVWQAYYLLLDTLRHAKPGVVVLSVYALCHGEPQGEAYNRLTLDGMRPSSVKLDALKASMSEGESFFSYIFPILRYHSRWSELTREDVDYLFKQKSISHNGYLMTGGSIAPDGEQHPDQRFDYELPARAMEYLEKIRLTCESEGITLVLVKSPTQSARYWWYDEWDRQVSEYAAAHGIDYYNLINNEKIGIYAEDYADGVHLNFHGAEKTSRYFGRILKQKYLVAAAPPAHSTREVWHEKTEKYYIERKNIAEKEK